MTLTADHRTEGHAVKDALEALCRPIRPLANALPDEVEQIQHLIGGTGALIIWSNTDKNQIDHVEIDTPYGFVMIQPARRATL